MKTKLLFLTLLFTTFIATGTYSADIRLAPYYSMEWTEGVSFPRPELTGWFFSGDLITDLGLIAKIGEKHTILPFYELHFTGPGLHRPEGSAFTDTSQDHVVFLQYQYILNPKITLKARGDWMVELYRSGADEAWGTGLYDFFRWGGQAKAELGEIGPLPGLDVFAEYHYFDFPRYTDLLSELKEEESTREVVGQDQHNIRSGVAFSKWGVNLEGSYAMQVYTTQEIIEEGGTYATGEKQFDQTLSANARYGIGKFWRADLDAGYTIHLSNQNYIRFDTSDILNVEAITESFVENYYSYTELNITPTLSINFPKGRKLFVSPEVQLRNYANRPARLSNGTNCGIQWNEIGYITVGHCWPKTAVSNTTMYYTYVTARSNNHYEVYYPYNYVAHFVGFKYTYQF